MSINPAEDRFLDYLEGRLTEAERGEFEQALSTSPELKRQLQEYVAVSNLGDEISKQEFELTEGFTADLMQRLDQQSRKQASGGAEVPIWFRRMLAPAALCATAVVALLVTSTNKSMDLPIMAPQHQARPAEQAANTVVAAGKAAGIPTMPKAKTEEASPIANELAGGRIPTTKMAGGVALSERERPNAVKGDEFNQALLEAESSSSSPDLSAPSLATVESDGIEAFGDLVVRPQVSAGGGERERAKKSAEVDKARAVAETAVLQAEVSNAAAERQVDDKAEKAKVSAIAPATAASSSESVLREELRLRSTPSIRLNRGSFAAIAESIAAGVLPAPADVKPADLINQFNFGYSSAVSKAAGPIAVFVEIAPSPLEQDRLLLMIGLKQRSPVPLGQLRFQLSLDSRQVASYRAVEEIEGAKVAPESGSLEVADELIDPQMLLAGQSATLLYEISLRSGGFSSREAELGVVKLSYSASGRRDALASIKVPFAVAETQNAAKAGNSDFKFAAAVNYFCRILRGDRSLRIGQVLDFARMAKGNDPDGKRSEFIAAVQSSAELLD